MFAGPPQRGQPFEVCHGHGERRVAAVGAVMAPFPEWMHTPRWVRPEAQAVVDHARNAECCPPPVRSRRTFASGV
jgi:hypothetical protein